MLDFENGPGPVKPPKPPKKPPKKPKVGGAFGGFGSGLNDIVSGVGRAGRNAGGGGRGRGGRNGGGGGGRNGRGRGGGGGGYGGGRGAGGSAYRPPVGNTPSGTVAKTVAPPPPPISVQDFISGDRTYQGQSSAYKKALADYAAQMRAEQNKYGGEYNAQVKQMGLDRTQGLEDLQNDFASRGLLQSGVYADAMGDYNKKVDTSLADLLRAKNAYMDDLTTGQTNFNTTQKTLLDKAYQDALNRRLEQIKG